MSSTNLHIFKWIFILFISKASGFMLYKVNGISEDQLRSRIVNLYLGNNVSSQYNFVLNQIMVKAKDQEKQEMQDFRRSINLKEFKNKILIKRAVPHGFKVPEYEYDEKFQALYKPLVRVHKNTEANKYDVVFILDEKAGVEDIQKVLNFEDNDAIDTYTNKFNGKKPLIKDFIGDEIEDILLNFTRVKKDNEKDNNIMNRAKIRLLSFGPMGMMKAKQLRKIPRRKKKKKKALRDNYEINSNNKQNDVFQNYKNPNTPYYNNADEKFIERILGIIIKEKVKKTQFADEDNNSAIAKINELTNYRSNINEDPDHKYEFLYRTDPKDTETRDLIKNKHDNKFQWFGPVGHIVGKQNEKHKIRMSNKLSQRLRKPLKIEGRVFSSVASFPEKRKEQQQQLTNPKLSYLWNGDIERSFKSREEPDLLAPFLGGEVPTTEKPKGWVSQYSLWNHWTYDKPIYQDECKGDLVRIGQICVALPPH